MRSVIGDVLGRRVDARTGSVGVVDEHMMYGSRTRPMQVGDVAAAGALDVVGVDGPAGDRGDRVLELARTRSARRCGARRDVVRVGVAQDVIDELG